MQKCLFQSQYVATYQDVGSASIKSRYPAFESFISGILGKYFIFVSILDLCESGPRLDKMLQTTTINQITNHK